MLLLEAAHPERLDGYSDHVKNLHNQFGPETWGILYRADTRMRSEFFERIRRALTENPSHGFTEASAWSAIFAQSVFKTEFWSREVTTPATLLLKWQSSESLFFQQVSPMQPVLWPPHGQRVHKPEQTPEEMTTSQIICGTERRSGRARAHCWRRIRGP